MSGGRSGWLDGRLALNDTWQIAGQKSISYITTVPDSNDNSGGGVLLWLADGGTNRLNVTDHIVSYHFQSISS